MEEPILQFYVLPPLSFVRMFCWKLKSWKASSCKEDCGKLTNFLTVSKYADCSDVCCCVCWTISMQVEVMKVELVSRCQKRLSFWCYWSMSDTKDLRYKYEMERVCCSCHTKLDSLLDVAQAERNDDKWRNSPIVKFKYSSLNISEFGFSIQ